MVDVAAIGRERLSRLLRVRPGAMVVGRLVGDATGAAGASVIRSAVDTSVGGRKTILTFWEVAGGSWIRERRIDIVEARCWWLSQSG